jgi:hypothetical protein
MLKTDIDLTLGLPSENNQNLCDKNNDIQVALVIRGFNYLRCVNFVQNLLSADISLGYPRIWSFFSGKKAI